MSWFSIQELEYLLRIVLAAVCGGAIGFERERRSKSAGIRTHIIVALSAALMMVVSKYGFFDVIGLGGISLDASRVAAAFSIWEPARAPACWTWYIPSSAPADASCPTRSSRVARAT